MKIKNVIQLNFYSSTTSDCSSYNGSVTFRVFENWLFNIFYPYIKSTYNSNGIKNFVLLFDAQLPLIDKEIIKSLKEHNSKEDESEKRLYFYGINKKDLLPFDKIFKKTVRNRQNDMFQDSWRKTVCSQNDSNSNKLKFESKHKFMHLFMDAFQNCIEECDDLDLLPSLDNSRCVGNFRIKMRESFDLVKLWPIRYNDYMQYIKNAHKKLKAPTVFDIKPMELDFDQNENEEEKSKKFYY